MESDSKTTFKSLQELEFALTGDNFYGSESGAKEIVDEIRDGKVPSHGLANIDYQFQRLPCKTNTQKLLIILWCGAMELGYYDSQSDDTLVRHTPGPLLRNWMSWTYMIKPTELKKFLRKYRWPLPARWYSEQPDATTHITSHSLKAFRQSQSPEQASSKHKPLQREQEDEILKTILSLGLDPKDMPPYKPGKPGIKNKIRVEIGKEHPLFKSTTVFDKAWERLLSHEDIVYGNDPTPPKNIRG